MNILTESNKAFQRKIEEIYEENIIMPKDDEASFITTATPSKLPDAEFTLKMQSEIAELHEKLQ